jgi:thymidylate synthase
MIKYLDIIKQTILNGFPLNIPLNKSRILPFANFEHDMTYGFPLLTAEFIDINSVAVELEGGLRGVVSKDWYRERGCHIWDETTNPEKVFVEYKYREHNPYLPYQTQKEVAKEIDDLGPIGGYQWRHFNKAYDENDGGTLETYDQLYNIIVALKTSELNHDMVCSAWNPQHMSRMATPPNYTSWNVVVIGNTINLGWCQSSSNLAYHVPRNIALFGLLLLLLAKTSNLIPGKLFGTLSNCYIYDEHINKLLHLTTKPYTLPKLKVLGDDPFVINKTLDITWKASDIEV